LLTRFDRPAPARLAWKTPADRRHAVALGVTCLLAAVAGCTTADGSGDESSESLPWQAESRSTAETVLTHDEAAMAAIRVPILVAARDIAVGEVLQLGDTAEVLMVVDDRLGLIEADSASAIVGSPLAVPVVAGRR
jgi:hypothetical protein